MPISALTQGAMLVSNISQFRNILEEELINILYIF